MMDETHESDINGAVGEPIGVSVTAPTPAPAPTVAPTATPTAAPTNGTHANGAKHSEPDSVTETEEIAVDSDDHVDQDESPPEKQEVNGLSGQPASVSFGRGQEDFLNNHTAQQCYPERNDVQSPRPVMSTTIGRASASCQAQEELPPVNIRPIPIGDPKVRSKIRFEVVTAKVVETAGKKHVAYTIMMKRAGNEPHPAVIERRYSDFCFIYECILKSFHPSVLGDFLFPKKVLIGNFKAEVISERTDAFHKFLNLIANCDNLLYSDYFYSFLSSEEHNEAVSHLKLARFSEAIPLLESIFYVREKLLSISNVHVLLCACELVACLSAEGSASTLETRRKHEEAFAYTDVALRSFNFVFQGGNHEDIMVAESLRVPFLKLGLFLATELGQNKKIFERQLSELRYSGVRIEIAPPLLDVIRDRYIHRASHTSKIS